MYEGDIEKFTEEIPHAAEQLEPFEGKRIVRQYGFRKDVILEAKSAGDVFAFAKAANTVFGAVAVAVAVAVSQSLRRVRRHVEDHGWTDADGVRRLLDGERRDREQGETEQTGQCDAFHAPILPPVPNRAAAPAPIAPNWEASCPYPLP